MNEEDINSIPIDYETEVRIQMNGYDFDVVYVIEDDVWFAEAYDEDAYDANIEIPGQLYDDVELFNGYVLTPDTFEKLQHIVTNIIEEGTERGK